MPNKVFYVNSEYIKRINKFWGEIDSENCQLFESFYRFQFTFTCLDKSIFCVRVDWFSSTHFSPKFAALINRGPAQYDEILSFVRYIQYSS